MFKNEAKLSVCKWHEYICRKPKDSTTKTDLLELINKFGKVTGYKIKIKNIGTPFLYV